MKFGISEDIVEKLTRWERIAVIRDKSNELATNGDEVSRFVRTSRFSLEQVKKIFDK